MLCKTVRTIRIFMKNIKQFINLPDMQKCHFFTFSILFESPYLWNDSFDSAQIQIRADFDCYKEPTISIQSVVAFESYRVNT